MPREAAPLDLARREEFMPPSLDGRPNATLIILDVPTPSERDRIGSRLFELGIIALTRETLRATIVSELYTLHDEAEADEQAAFLDEFWVRQEVHELEREAWRRRESRRRLEIALGVTERPTEPVPAPAVTMREQAKARLIVDEVSAASARMRSLAARIDDYPRAVEAMTARLAIKGVMPGPGAAEPFPLELDGDHEKITEESLNRLREHIGERAWGELLGRVVVLFAPPPAEEPAGTADPGSGGQPQGEGPGATGETAAAPKRRKSLPAAASDRARAVH